MARYIVEWQMGGEIAINTDGTDWTPGEVEMQVSQSLIAAVDRVVDEVADEFDDCQVRGDGTDEFTLRRLT